jgi:hypothetical protein
MAGKKGNQREEPVQLALVRKCVAIFAAVGWRYDSLGRHDVVPVVIC